jgi:hypothetical protein
VADLRHPLIVTYGDNETMQPGTKPGTHEIAHVSDTALMTAACRDRGRARSPGLPAEEMRTAGVAATRRPSSETLVTQPFC